MKKKKNISIGIGIVTISIIFWQFGLLNRFNYFTAKIDGMSYRIDEASFTISQAFANQHKK